MSDPIRWTNLSRMNQSPAHYKWALDHPTDPTPAMRVGALVHELVLEGALSTFVCFDGVRRGKKWDQFQIDNPGCEILNRREWDSAQFIADAVKRNADAMALLMAGNVEETLLWKVNGRDCQGTPDSLGQGITDLKITNNANPVKFPWHARSMLWHAQLAFYGNACEKVHGYRPDRYSIVAVEASPPHATVIYDLTPEAVEAGEKIWRSLFERLCVCIENDHWPAYTDGGIALIDAGPEATTIIIDGEEIDV